MALSDHGQYSGVVDIARNGIDEVIRLQTQAKQDEALIRQMESALSWSSPHADAAHGWKSENWARKRSEAITAARARLLDSDLSNLTERGAKAWAGVDAQGLRDGGASPSANAGEPSAHIKEPYTLAEIKAKIASNDYSAEMLLQHAMLLLDSASLSANAGEPRNAIDRDALIDAIAQGLHGTWHCTRVWEAWHVGTMSQDDFEPVDESETPTEIADAVLALLAAPGPADGESK